MSVVYLARDISDNHIWAVKETDIGSEHGEKIIRISQVIEKTILGKLNHPGLPKVVDVIYETNAVYVVMDYIEGRPLCDVISEEGPQTLKHVLDWGLQLCDALDYLHNMSVVYGDMKPSNILLKPNGKVVLVDFGAACIYSDDNRKPRVVFGTKGYAAPEQLDSSVTIDKRADIYSLGITLHYLLTGNDPCLPGYNPNPIRKTNPRFSKKLERIISKCTDENPNKRYQNCKKLYNALATCGRRQGIISKMIFAVLTFCVAIGSYFYGNQSLYGNLSEISGNTILKKYPQITDNYKVLCKAYSTCIYTDDNAFAELEKNANKGLESLYLCTDNKQEYVVIFNNYLSLINEKKGDEATDQTGKYYEAAIKNCDAILDAISVAGSVWYDNIKKDTVMEVKSCQKAALLTKLKRYSDAEEVYQKVIEEYGTASVDGYVGYLRLLLLMYEEQRIGKQEYSKIMKLYEVGEAADNIREDYRWRRLTQKLSLETIDYNN
ncbi:MAG: serine/threonine protein kinase [Lachnospiraceae bacterium]|nr:serine/threonine protein kinase [Lachnospiraceae bacterium]